MTNPDAIIFNLDLKAIQVLAVPFFQFLSDNCQVLCIFDYLEEKRNNNNKSELWRICRFIFFICAFMTDQMCLFRLPLFLYIISKTMSIFTLVATFALKNRRSIPHSYKCVFILIALSELIFTLSGSNDSIFKKDPKIIAETNLSNIQQNFHLLCNSFIIFLILLAFSSCNLFNFKTLNKVSLLPAFLLNIQLVLGKWGFDKMMAENNFEIGNIVTNPQVIGYLLILVVNSSIVCNIITNSDWVLFSCYYFGYGILIGLGFSIFILKEEIQNKTYFLFGLALQIISLILLYRRRVYDIQMYLSDNPLKIRKEIPMEKGKEDIEITNDFGLITFSSDKVINADGDRISSEVKKVEEEMNWYDFDSLTMPASALEKNELVLEPEIIPEEENQLHLDEEG